MPAGPQPTAGSGLVLTFSQSPLCEEGLQASPHLQGAKRESRERPLSRGRMETPSVGQGVPAST